MRSDLLTPQERTITDDEAKADNGTLKSVYDKRSARRARGWAARKRNGWAPPASAQPESNPFGGEDVSF